MNSLFKAHKDEQNANGMPALTAAMFFGTNGGTAYVTPSDFLSYGESLRHKEADDVKKIILSMKEGKKMDGNPSKGIDVGLRSYTFHRAFNSKAISGFKIIDGGGMPELIQDFQDGKITVGFTLDDLIEEARKA